MAKFAKIIRIAFISFSLVFLFPDKNLLASSVVNSYAQSQEDDLNSNTFLFQKKVDTKKFDSEELQLYKEQAILAAKNNDVSNASQYVEYYIKYSSEVGFLDSGYFTQFKETDEFSELYRKYSVNFSWLYFFYLFSAIIGFFIVFLFLIKKQKDLVSTFLISSFVLINSVFIFQIFLLLTNLKYRTPHILYLSSLTIYLYGPLIYFYFKRILLNYHFKKWDLLHLLPTLIIFLIFTPVLLLSAKEKLNIMLDVGSFDSRPYLIFTVSTKILSLIIYGYLLIRLYLKNKKRINLFSKTLQKWMFNLVFFVGVYIVSYLIYGIIIMKLSPDYGFLFHIQVSVIAAMVLYIGFNSYLRPNIFAVDSIQKHSDERTKYVKSCLTTSYSSELKDRLIYLLETEKVYKHNDINLDFLSEKLDTTRHNTSQVINENFNLSFFELINTYRIEEALEILNNNSNNMNIIEVAYAVGFNNKVSFNKSFKKILSQTPSEYIIGLKANFK